jgi:aspartyl-tRNA(Asn)/glutamyl-tRNA(Gln) amidotransferase subunit A
MPDRSIAEAGAQMRAGKLTARALAEAHLDRIAAENPAIRAFVAVTPDQALARAAQADADFAAGIDRGPMQGIPFAVKDLVDMAGLPTTCGSRAASAAPATADAAVVERLLAAGAVPLGKVATYEYALVGPSFDAPHPPPVNPWNPDHITGGSSSGSAAAVAAGLVRVAIGTDTGGSIRSPACYCGVVGLKPTRGLVSRHGIFPLSPDLDHAGPLAASVAEAALMLDAMSGVDARDPASRPGGTSAAAELGQPIAGMNIGYARDWFATDPALDPAVLRAMDEAVSALSLLGARISLITLPDYAVMEAAGAIILHHQALAIHRDRLHAYGRQALQSLLAGLDLTGADLAEARKAARHLQGETDAILSRFDAVVTANVLAPAPPFAAFAGNRAVWTAMRTLPFNVTGHPVLALPIGFADGLPLGLQLIGPDFSEARLCRIGHAFEAATDHAAQRPPRQTGGR